MKGSAKVISLVLALSLGLAEHGMAGDSQPTAIRISGSQTMLVLTHRLAEWYENRYKGVAFQIEGSNPTQGFSSLVEGKADIAQSTRKALGGEVGALRSRRKLEYVEIPVATEFAVMAVNAANPVRSLTTFDLRMILSGQIRNWKQVGGKDAAIHLYGRDESSEVRNLIEDEIMGDASISDSVKALATNTAVMSAVAGDSEALAFCDIDLHPQGGVRLLGIKASMSSEAIEPTGENLRAHKYTLSRTLYFYFAGAPSPELTRFAAWVTSPEGQLVVEAVGLYPLGSADREEARLRLKNARGEVATKY
jgi:phosphate transport system substrate-binding protein